MDNKAIEAVSAHLQPILRARLNSPIKIIPEPDLEVKIAELVIVSFTELGIGIEGKEDIVSFIRQTLLNDLRHPKYQHLSFEIIRHFVSNGIRGQYGTFKNQLNTINVQNIHHWINEGLKSEEYKRSMSEFNEAVFRIENKKESRDTPPNPEGLKRIAEMLKGVVKEIPKDSEVKKERKKIVKTDREIYIQKLLTDFEKIRVSSPGIDEKTRKELPGMFIQYEGKAIDLTEFLTIKLTEYDQTT